MSQTQGNLTYEKKILIRSEQVDMTRKLRMSELFRIMEEASIAHTEELGCTREKTLDRGLLWIITRQEADIEEMPCYDEEITVRSWQGDMMHVFFPRFYEIEKAGRVIIKGRALWMLLDEETREMVMPEDYGIEIPGRPGSDDMMLPPVVIPAALREKVSVGANECGEPVNGDVSADAESACCDASAQTTGPVYEKELVTRFSQVDINGHMNNTRYFDILDDALYELWASKNNITLYDPLTPRLVRANYLSELRAGARFDLKGYRAENGALLFEGADEDKVKFRIALEY